MGFKDACGYPGFLRLPSPPVTSSQPLDALDRTWLTMFTYIHGNSVVNVDLSVCGYIHAKVVGIAMSKQGSGGACQRAL